MPRKVLAITPEGEIAFTYHKTEASFAEPLDDAEGQLQILDTPSQGVKTIYARYGDWFAYSSIAFALGAIVFVVYRRVY